MWILGLLFGCFVGWIYCTVKQNQEKEDAAYYATHIRTNESYIEASRDISKLTSKQFAKRLDSGYYDTLKADAWQDEAGGWHKIGEKPVYFHKYFEK